MGSRSTSAAAPRDRWYHPTPGRFVVGLLLVEAVLLVSERFEWFAFNRHKGFTVLIAVATVVAAIVLMLLWLVASLLLRWRFQFGLRTLFALGVAVAVPCSWLAVQIEKAKEQRRL
jgi:hypothetical protein